MNKRMIYIEKTKDVYAFKSNSRKSVFTPNLGDDTENVRGQIIDKQIEDLREVQDSLSTKLRSMEIKLNSLKRRLNTLNQAEDAIKRFSPNSMDLGSTLEDGFEFIKVIIYLCRMHLTKLTSLLY